MTEEHIPTSRPLKVLLDANVIRDFFTRPNKPGRSEEDCVEDRTALHAAIRAGVVAIVATDPIWHELTEFHSGHGDPALWRKVARWFLAISPILGLRTLYVRSQLELVVKRPLLDREAFEALDIDRMAAAIDNDDLVSATHAEQHEEKVADLAQQACMRRETLEGLREHGEAWRQELQAAYETKDALIQQYVHGQIEADVAGGLLSHDGEWPTDLRALRSTYFREAFYVERAHWVFVEERQQDPTSAKNIGRTPDLYDSAHFADAAYADVFVTGDATLALLAKRTGLVTVWTRDELLEWARSALSSSITAGARVATARSLSASSQKAFVRVHVPHDVVHPGEREDGGEFKKLARSLSLHDSLLWCGRINAVLQSSEPDPREVQQRLAQVFFTKPERERMDTLVPRFGRDIALFFRGQLLELARFLALHAKVRPHDGVTFENPQTRHRFGRAALLASSAWSSRVYPDDLEVRDGPEATRNRVLPSMRRVAVENTTGRSPFITIARGLELNRLLFQGVPTGADRFAARTGMTLQDYQDAITVLCVHAMNAAAASLQDFAKGALMSVPGEGERDVPLVKYIELESQSPAALRDALTEVGAERHLLDAMRTRPLLRFPDGRLLILDPATFAQRAVAGPLFYLSEGDRKHVYLNAFGAAFEEYVNELLARAVGAGGQLAPLDSYVANPKARTLRREERELADGLLSRPTVAALVESKGVWLPEGASNPDGSGVAYQRAVRAKYGSAENSKHGTGKGAAQLAAKILGLADGSLASGAIRRADQRILIPVLVVYDDNMGAFGHSRFLAQEFVAALHLAPGAVEQPELMVGRLRVRQLVLLTCEDLEHAEMLSPTIPVLDLLLGYDASAPGRLLSFRNYCAGDPGASRDEPNPFLDKRFNAHADEVLERMR